MIISTSRQATDTRIRVAGVALEWIGLLALIGVVLFLALLNLPYAPRTWFDEGSHLHVPKTLVQHGVYADISSEGYRYDGPTIGIGPTIMLPIALVFKLFGVGLLQGRLVIVAYLFVAVAACYTFGRLLHGPRVALLALALLLASRSFTYEGLIEYGRQVLGEVPGVAYLLLGSLAWLAALRSIDESRQPTVSSRRFAGFLPTGYCILAGLGFGLALVTKNQFVLIVPPTLLLIALLDWRYYCAGAWQLRLIPLAIACMCFAIWTWAQFQFIGPGTFFQNMQQTRRAAGGSIFVFDLRATLRAGYYLLRPDLYGGLLVPALGYALWRARRRDRQGLAEGFVALLIGLWLAWFVMASLGWPRYAFPAVAFSALIIARALADLLGWMWRGIGLRRMLAWPVAGYLALVIAVPLALTTRAVLSPDNSAQRFAAYLDAHVPRNALIETWEPELGLLTDHRYHYPTRDMLDRAVRHEWLGGPAPVYNSLELKPAYVVVGSFGSYTSVYAPAELARDYIEEQQIGTYVLFKRTN